MPLYSRSNDPPWIVSIRVDRVPFESLRGHRCFKPPQQTVRSFLPGFASRAQTTDITMDIGTRLSVGSAKEWRGWLEAHSASERDIWVVFYKKGSGKRGITLPEAIEEALCFGWVDSQLKGIDAESYALRFTPRGKNSHWSAANRDLARRLLHEGRMSDRGRAALPPDWHGEPTDSQA